MEEDITKKPLVDLMTELSITDQKIELLMVRYELLRLELIRRFLMFEEREEFKKKIFKK